MRGAAVERSGKIDPSPKRRLDKCGYRVVAFRWRGPRRAILWAASALRSRRGDGGVRAGVRRLARQRSIRCQMCAESFFEEIGAFDRGQRGCVAVAPVEGHGAALEAGFCLLCTMRRGIGANDPVLSAILFRFAEGVQTANQSQCAFLSVRGGCSGYAVSAIPGTEVDLLVRGGIARPSR